MKKLIIEWKHLDVDGETCNRCYDTGENLNQEIKRLNRTLKSQEIIIELIYTKLSDNQIEESNSILFNGIPIEYIIDIQISENHCESCSSLVGKKINCRSVIYEGNEYEDVPAKAIRHASLRILGLDKGTINKANCCGNNNNCC